MDIEDKEKLVNEIIDALSKNQELLDNKKKKLSIRELTKFIADMNFSLLEIFKNIKQFAGESSKSNELDLNKISSIFT